MVSAPARVSVRIALLLLPRPRPNPRQRQECTLRAYLSLYHERSSEPLSVRFEMLIQEYRERCGYVGGGKAMVMLPELDAQPARVQGRG